MNAPCSRGWAERCAKARSARCTCGCGGRNHGNPAARRAEQMIMKLTDTSIFEPEWSDETGERVDTRVFLEGAWESDRDIRLYRVDGTAHADIDQQYVVHSPTGFEWGYGGSGPADLALNILGLFVPAPEAYRLHLHFKWDRIGRLERDADHVIHATDVRHWIVAQWAKEDARVSA